MDEDKPLIGPAVAHDPNDNRPVQIRDRIRGLIRVKARDLVRNKKNWRRHPRAQANALRGVLEEIGYANALVVRQLPNGLYEIIDGHLRAETTPDMMVPVLVLDVTEEEADKLLALLDPMVGMAESNKEKLADLLKTFRSDNDALLGLLRQTAGNRLWLSIHPDELDNAVVSPDLADRLMGKWGTRKGQLWQIGPHHAICDDSTKETVLRRLFEATHPALFRILLTDSPYGVSLAGKNEFLNELDRGNRVQRPIANDHDPVAAPSLFSAALRLATNYAEKAASCYATVPGGPLLPDFIGAFNESGFSFKSLLIWLKSQFVLGRSDYQFRHENILYGWIENDPHYFIHDRTQDSVFEFAKPHASEMHPTSKPVDLFARIISNSSRTGELVYDPFLGSGTTIVAAHQLGRVAYGCEIEPCYLAVILERLSMLGLKPELVQ
jgi:DNA modification methylase